MNLQDAQAEFRELQKSYRSGAIDRDTFLHQAAGIVVRDERGTYWTPDARTGEWLHYDGRDWVPATPPAPEGVTEVIPVLPSKRGCSTGAVLLVGGAAAFFLLIVAGLLAYRMWGFTAPRASTPVPGITPAGQAPHLAVLHEPAEIRSGPPGAVARRVNRRVPAGRRHGPHGRRGTPPDRLCRGDSRRAGRECRNHPGRGAREGRRAAGHCALAGLRGHLAQTRRPRDGGSSTASKRRRRWSAWRRRWRASPPARARRPWSR